LFCSDIQLLLSLWVWLLFFFVSAVDKGSRGRKLKHDVIEAVNDLIQDISTCYEQIAEQAVEHIHQK
jgi:translation initiation factor 2B subunit (eIF-2B alpha/beta/delta family)